MVNTAEKAHMNGFEAEAPAAFDSDADRLLTCSITCVYRDITIRKSKARDSS